MIMAVTDELRKVFRALGLEALEGQLLPIIIAVVLIVVSSLGEMRATDWHGEVVNLLPCTHSACVCLSTEREEKQCRLPRGT